MRRLKSSQIRFKTQIKLKSGSKYPLISFPKYRSQAENKATANSTSNTYRVSDEVVTVLALALVHAVLSLGETGAVELETLRLRTETTEAVSLHPWGLTAHN